MDDRFPVEYIFARAARGFRGDRTISINGKNNNETIGEAKIFKRRVLGICGTYSIKSLDELAGILHNIGAVSSFEEGKKFVPRLYGFRLDYGGGILNFIEVEKDNKKACLITRDNCFYKANIIKRV